MRQDANMEDATMLPRPGDQFEKRTTLRRPTTLGSEKTERSANGRRGLYDIAVARA
jgi:hypothetical protein